MKPEISIVVPVFNSETSIVELHRRIDNALTSVAYELILVDDGSGDNSWQQIEVLSKSDTRVKGISLRKNSGQDNSILAGMRHAQGNYVVIMDDDLQHAPEDIMKLYNKCFDGHDVVYADFKGVKHAMHKQSGSWLNAKVAQWLLDKPGNLYLAPFKILRKTIADECCLFAGPFPYIDAIILSLTSRIEQVEVEHHHRKEGRSNYTIRRSASVFFKMFTGFSVAPLRIATVTGLCISLIGLALILFYLYEYFITKNYVEGWTTIVILLIFFGGLITLFLGLIGEYVGRIYLTLNHKPQYSIRATLNLGADKG